MIVLAGLSIFMVASSPVVALPGSAVVDPPPSWRSPGTEAVGGKLPDSYERPGLSATEGKTTVGGDGIP